jgi:hypothetical protein
MSDKVQVSGGGISFCGLLTVLFIALKMTGYVAWSWWWVLSPLWIPWAILLGILAVAAICFLIFLGVTALIGS